MNSRATQLMCVSVHFALRILLALSQPVNCIFWPIKTLNLLVAASKLHKHRGILDLQRISRKSPDNVTRLLRLVPTIELTKYSFVPHHQHGRRAGQEYVALPSSSEASPNLVMQMKFKPLSLFISFEIDSSYGL